MATIRRILKYTPAVVMGLLIVAWVVSWFVIIGYASRQTGWTVLLGSSDISCIYVPYSSLFDGWVAIPRIADKVTLRTVVGSPMLDFEEFYNPVAIAGQATFILDIPLPGVLIAILPLAIGPFLSFRFRLWHYLAYTALVAVELAYYLRWQE